MSDIFIDRIETLQTGQFNIIELNYRNSDSNEDLKVVFINTKDSSIRQFKGINLYNYIVEIVEKIDKSYISNMNSDSVIAINYTKELIEELDD